VTTFLIGASKIYSRERKRKEPKMAEEYCWEITQATVR